VLGGWVLGFGAWAPTPNPQSPNPHEFYIHFLINLINKLKSIILEYYIKTNKLLNAT
jgi:hypothetical protein